MVEEDRALGGRELHGLELAHVTRPVQVDAAPEIPGHALVHGDVPVLVHADEVRPRERPERNREDGGDEGQPERAEHGAASPAGLAAEAGAGLGAGSSSSAGPHSRSATAVAAGAGAAIVGASRPVSVSSRSSSWPRPLPDATTVSSSPPSPSASRKRTTVTLSSPPALFAALTSPLPAWSRSFALRHEVADLIVVDHRRQPVGAEEEEVVGLGRHRERVDVDLRIRPQRTRDHRALRMGVRFLRRDAARFGRGRRRESGRR